MNVSQQQEMRVYSVWDLPVRLFHWVNFLSVISLLFMGFIMLYKKELGITSLEAKIGLKQVHVVIGYVFVVNLLIRFAWAFIGNRFARWSAFLPYRGVLSDARRHAEAVRQGQPQAYLGHNPLGRLAIVLLLLLMTTKAVTGLVRAGTDIYFPPLAAGYRNISPPIRCRPQASSPMTKPRLMQRSFRR